MANNNNGQYIPGSATKVIDNYMEYYFKRKGDMKLVLDLELMKQFRKIWPLESDTLRVTHKKERGEFENLGSLDIKGIEETFNKENIEKFRKLLECISEGDRELSRNTIFSIKRIFDSIIQSKLLPNENLHPTVRQNIEELSKAPQLDHEGFNEEKLLSPSIKALQDKLVNPQMSSINVGVNSTQKSSCEL